MVCLIVYEEAPSYSILIKCNFFISLFGCLGRRPVRHISSPRPCHAVCRIPNIREQKPATCTTQTACILVESAENAWRWMQQSTGLVIKTEALLTPNFTSPIYTIQHWTNYPSCKACREDEAIGHIVNACFIVSRKHVQDKVLYNVATAIHRSICHASWHQHGSKHLGSETTLSCKKYEGQGLLKQRYSDR